MDSMKAWAVLAFCAGVHVAALPQNLALNAATATTTAVGPATGSAAAGVTVGQPAPGLPVAAPGLALPAPVPGIAVPKAPLPLPNVGGGGLPVPLPNVGGAGLPVPSTPKLPVVDSLPLPATPDIPKLPVGDSLPLPLPAGGSVPKLPVPLPIPNLPGVAGGDVASSDALDKVIKLGVSALELILNVLSKGASILKLPGTEIVHSLPVGALPNGSIPISKRQLPLPLPSPGVGGLLGGVTGSLPVVGGAVGGVTGGTSGSSPLGAVTGAVGGVPVVGGALGGVTGGTSGSSPLGAVTGAVGGVPVVGGAVGGVTGGTSGSSPLGAVTGAVGGVPVVGGALGGVTGGTNPLGAVTGAVGTVANAVGSVPVVGGAVAPVLNTVGGVAGGATGGVAGASGGGVNPNINPLPFTGIPGADPVGAFSISVIATLLSMLKKDPLSLFAPSLPIPALVKRDLPELHKRDIPELAKRQLNFLPSLSTGVPGVGVGSLPGSGIPGIPPDLAFLVGSIAKNIAVPGGTGLGSITSKILGVLNGVVPNFLFQLPVVQDSVPTFGVLQLLSSINPTKFKDLAGLTNLSALQQAASTIPASDLAFIKTLPVSPDPTNLITTIMTLSDNILSCPGNVANLRATVAVLCMKNLGLAVAGL